MMVNQRQVLEDIKDDLLDNTYQDYSNCILFVSMTKKVPSIIGAQGKVNDFLTLSP